MEPATITKSASVRVAWTTPCHVVSGFEVFQAVKLAPHAPVVFVLTNLTSFEYQIACLEAGAEFFLDKSFGFERLADILRELARQSGHDCNERNIL